MLEYSSSDTSHTYLKFIIMLNFMIESTNSFITTTDVQILEQFDKILISSSMVPANYSKLSRQNETMK
jgi:hypothetical protein